MVQMELGQAWVGVWRGSRSRRYHDPKASSVNSGVAMYLFIARVPLNIAQVSLNIVPIAHVASIAIPGFTDDPELVDEEGK